MEFRLFSEHNWKQSSLREKMLATQNEIKKVMLSRRRWKVGKVLKNRAGGAGSGRQWETEAVFQDQPV